MHFDPQMRTETFDIGDGVYLSTSPEGKWLAYITQSKESPTTEWLNVISADCIHRGKVPLDIHLVYLGYYAWLDNQNLIFPLV